jgi:hypothetical protein
VSDPRARVTYDFGDRVRVRTFPATVDAGIAEQSGVVMGWTTPSLGYATEIVGDPVEDVAISVQLTGREDAVWLTPDLIEVLDRGEGTSIVIGTRRFVRASDGTWQPEADKGGSP